MKLTIHDEKLEPRGEPIKAFELITKKGYACGFYYNNTLNIHHIGTNQGHEHPIKGLMSVLCNRFNTNKFKILMVINPELKNILKGKVVIVPADAKDNPFGEELEEIHGKWERG